MVWSVSCRVLEKLFKCKLKENTNHTQKMDYQKLFNYMSEEHGLTLLQTDMQEICNIVREMDKEDQSFPTDGDGQERKLNVK